MPTQYKIDINQNYIHVKVSGTFSFIEYKSIIEVILSECVKNNKSSILFDEREVEGNMTTWERYNLSVYFSKLSREHTSTFKVKIAVVGFPPLIDPDRFGETVALNRGININVTNDIDEAIRWLQIDKVTD